MSKNISLVITDQDDNSIGASYDDLFYIGEDLYIAIKETGYEQIVLLKVIGEENDQKLIEIPSQEEFELVFEVYINRKSIVSVT